MSSLTRAEVVLRQLTLDDATREELDRLREEGELGDCVKTEPRCWVCCEAESRELVNKLIAAGLTNREITESCGHINGRRRAKGDHRIIESGNIYRHRKEHFNIDAPAQAVYREIAERRAEEANVDHINGVGHAITPYAVLETVMTKGYANLTSNYTTVSVGEMMSSAVKLHELASRDADSQKMADIIYKVDRIMSAIFSTVPQEYHAAILAEIDGVAQPSIPEVAVDHVVAPVRKAMRELTPDRSGDEGDKF